MLCPMQLMADYGVDPVKDVENLHTSRNIAHESLKKGDVAALGTNHNSWLRVRNKDESVPNGFFRVIARSGDLPNDMLMVASHVDAAKAEGVRKSILDNKEAVISGIIAHEENDNIPAWTWSRSKTAPMTLSGPCIRRQGSRNTTTSSANDVAGPRLFRRRTSAGDRL